MTGKMSVSNLELNVEVIKVLRHDLHKVRIPGAAPHKTAMSNRIAKESDALAAWLGRNCLKEEFEATLYRKSLIFPMQNYENPRPVIRQHRAELTDLFSQSDAVELHNRVLNSKLLNFYCESRRFPYSSLKYHILLTCALFYNFNQNFTMKDLYLCEDLPTDSPFQIIYHDHEREWAILPKRKIDGLSRIHPLFYTTWERRKKISLGGDSQILNGIISSIGSWTVALACIEDFQEL